MDCGVVVVVVKAQVVLLVAVVEVRAVEVCSFVRNNEAVEVRELKEIVVYYLLIVCLCS